MIYQIPKPFYYSVGVIYDNQGAPVLEIRTDNSHSANELAYMAQLAVIGLNFGEITYEEGPSGI